MNSKNIERDGPEKHLIADDSFKDNPKLLITPREAAKALAISPRKLWGMTSSGEVPHIRLGRCVRYPVADLQNWIDDRKICDQ